MKNTWQPTVAGILTIVAGATGVISGLATWSFPFHLFFFAGPAICLGAVAIIGGIFALKRQNWGFSLAGAICSTFIAPVSALGIAAIIFLAISKKEFKQHNDATPSISAPQS
jgi:hypothetical protein